MPPTTVKYPACLSAKNALIQGCRPHILIEYSINSKDTFLVILQSLSLTVWYITKTQLIRPTALPALAPTDDVYDDHVLWVSGPSHSPSVCLQLNNKIQKIKKNITISYAASRDITKQPAAGAGRRQDLTQLNALLSVCTLIHTSIADLVIRNTSSPLTVVAIETGLNSLKRALNPHESAPSSIRQSWIGLYYLYSQIS